MDNLKFRRQFLLSPVRCAALGTWTCVTTGKYYLYVHPDCEMVRAQNDKVYLILVGYALDPKTPNSSTADILKTISAQATIESIARNLYGLTGRFVLIARRSTALTIFHDACGLKSVVYTKHAENVYAASQPLLLALVTAIREGENLAEYFGSQYVNSNIEHWIPSGISLYRNVYHLVPNHYLDVAAFRQVRYWPVRAPAKLSFEDAVEKFALILSSSILAAVKRFPLSLAMTAGWDSRIVLSACKPIAKDLSFYTLQYRNLTRESPDIRIPAELLPRLGLQHQIIDTRKPMDENFADVFEHNSDIAHLNDWGVITNGMRGTYPSNRIAMRGNCLEVARCHYYQGGRHPAIRSGDFFLHLDDDWRGIGFIEDRTSAWLDEVKDAKVNLGYKLLDLFYWEHRMGGWQAQSLLEWDIVHDTFTPFNNRELLDIALGVDAAYRCYPNYLFFGRVIRKLWSETLSLPINPKSKLIKIKDLMKRLLVTIGIYSVVKESLRKA